MLYGATAASAFDFCGVVMNDTEKIFSFAQVNNATGIVDDIVKLPTLDGFGLGVSAGATRDGLYFTVSGTVKEQEEVFVVDVTNHSTSYVQVDLPTEFDFLTLYGIAMLDVNSAGELLAMVMGYSADSERYCFLGEVDPSSGSVTKVAYNLTDAYREWVYLYSGVSAWDSDQGLYYLEAVEGARDLTSLYVFNISDTDNEGIPLAQLPSPRDGMFTALQLSPEHGLIALVDDDENTAAAIWQLVVPQNNWTAAQWKSLHQYSADTLVSDGNNNFLLSDDGHVAYSVFYDDHQPIANQVVSAVDLRSKVETGRTVVQGSENGTASIADLVTCPPSMRN